MLERLRFILNRLRERLWVKPLLMALVSVALVFIAEFADDTGLKDLVPKVSKDSVIALLQILASSMLVIATFSVASMVSAYASAANTATPRSFVLVIADDASQNALSWFIGAFIFSVVALIAVKNSYYAPGGMFVLFVVTLLFFLIVILTFVRWVDRIARLGRMTNTLAMVERAADSALQRRRLAPALGASVLQHVPPAATAVYARKIGYLQRVDVHALQNRAVRCGLRIAVAVVPGTFIDPQRVLAWVSSDAGAPASTSMDLDPIIDTFVIGDSRTFDDDPRFGLIVMSEIASRALSPAVNDPGTAIDVIGRLVRLLCRATAPLSDGEDLDMDCDRIALPSIAIADLFDDAFHAIARDGASMVEVALRLQKALSVLAVSGGPDMQAAATDHARWALARAQQVLTLPSDLDRVRAAAQFALLD
jgi:uncharacterized membrane protein